MSAIIAQRVAALYNGERPKAGLNPISRTLAKLEAFCKDILSAT